MTRRGRIATDRLTMSLIQLARQGIRPRCGDGETSNCWTSEHEPERQSLQSGVLAVQSRWSVSRQQQRTGRAGALVGPGTSASETDARRSHELARPRAAKKTTFFIRGSFHAEIDDPDGPRSTFLPNLQLCCQEPEPRSRRDRGGYERPK
jgi:hypothetical protein